MLSLLRSHETALPVEGASADDIPDLLPGWYAVSVHVEGGGKVAIPDGHGGRRVVPLHGYEYFRAFRPVASIG
jgi:hypothetical protein